MRKNRIWILFDHFSCKFSLETSNLTIFFLNLCTFENFFYMMEKKWLNDQVRRNGKPGSIGEDNTCLGDPRRLFIAVITSEGFAFAWRACGAREDVNISISLFFIRCKTVFDDVFNNRFCFFFWGQPNIWKLMFYAHTWLAAEIDKINGIQNCHERIQIFLFLVSEIIEFIHFHQ